MHGRARRDSPYTAWRYVKAPPPASLPTVGSCRLPLRLSAGVGGSSPFLSRIVGGIRCPPLSRLSAWCCGCGERQRLPTSASFSSRLSPCCSLALAHVVSSASLTVVLLTQREGYVSPLFCSRSASAPYSLLCLSPLPCATLDL